ncbi:PKD domain-containing protein [Halomicroarcula sp. GCM10025710]
MLDTAIHANVTAVPDRPRSAETIAFDGLDSYSLFGSIDSHTWSFGDGTTASGQRVTHSYATPGTYEVALTVEDTDGFRDTVRTRLTVEDRSPRAVFGTSRGQVETGQQVTFNGSRSVDPEGQIASHEWDFGDGSVDTGSSATHSYTSAGTYGVTLTVTDGAGNTATVTRTLTVRTPNQPPTAAFDASDASPEAGTQVEFDASGSADADGQVQAYGWEFGDGTNATGQRVTHRFASSGTYTVKLSVRDDRGVVRTTASEVDVAASEGAQPSTSASSPTPATERAVETTAVEESSSDESDGGILAALGNLLRDIFNVFG